MSRKNVCLIAATMILTTGFQQGGHKNDQTSLIEFSPKDGGFSIMMPDKPSQRDLSHNTDNGKASSPLYELTKDAFKYVITYLDYPFSAEGKERDKLLDTGAEAGITNVGGKVVSNTPISIDSYPGREVKGEMQGILYRSRVYLVRQRLYLLIVWMPTTKASSENATKFLESFKLVAR